jgi:hypothetical protein
MTEPPDLDLGRPNPARMYDYFLGGFHNLEADREAARAAEQAFPGVQAAARANRDFVRRAVRFMSGEGVDQFLDLGSGIPTVGNVHEIAQATNPGAAVVYVDNEPVAVKASELMLAGNPAAAMLRADIRDPDRVLCDPLVRDLLDFARPLGLVMASVLPYVPEADDPDSLVARYRAALPPGSYMLIAHGSVDTFDREATRDVYSVYNATATPITSRSYERIRSWFDGLDPVEPGVVVVTEWRPEPGSRETALRLPHYGGVGLVR